MSIVLAGSNPSDAKEPCSGKAVVSPQQIGYLVSALRCSPICLLFLISRCALADCSQVTGNETVGCTAVTAVLPLTIQAGATLNGRISMTGAGATLNVANGGTFRYLPNAPGGGSIAVGMTAANQTLTNNGTIGVTVPNAGVDVIAARATGFTIINGATGIIASNNASPFANAITNFDAGVSGTVINLGTISSTGGASEGTIYMPGAGGVFTLDNRQGATIRGDTAIAVNVTGTKQTILRNAGTISTGVAGGTAISLGGGSDSVTLESTSSVTGIVNGQAGIDTLSLGGVATNGNFNIGLIGAAAQYRNFELFRKIEPGTWTLSGSAVTATSWTVAGGTLRLGSSSLGLTSLTATGGDIGYNDGVVNASPVILNSAARLIVDGTDHATQTGIISGSGTAAKDGTGTLILTGTNTYTGGTQITAGTLQLGAAGLSGSITGNVLNNGTLAFNRSDAISFPGVISGTGSVAQMGSGTTTLTGLNTYAGGTVISAGTLLVAQDANLGAANGGLTFDGGTLHNTASLTMNRPVFFNGLGTIDTAPGLVLSNAGDSSGAGSLQKKGDGVLVLTGANTYTGGTLLSAGTLQLGDGGTSGSLAGDILNNGTLSFNRSDAVLLPGTVSGTGTLNQIGTGTTVLAANHTYTGGTTISAGTLQLGDGGASGSLVGNVTNNGTLAFNRSDESLFAGVISGAGAVSQIGTGTTVLSGANTWSGPTSVLTGTLRAGATDTFSPSSAFAVAAGATLDSAGFNQSVAALQNAGTVSLSSATVGRTLTVTGAYSGNSGVLRVGTGLDGSNSVSDRLVLSGPTASALGNTTLQITSLNGLGAPTTGDGIEVVSGINGATSTAQTSRSAFNLANGHVDAGAFEYRLYAANAQGAGESWYLRTEVPLAVAPANAPGQQLPTDPAPPGQPPPAGQPSQTVRLVPTYRAEVPLFAALPAQLRQADLAMLGNLHQRIGDEPRAGSSAAPSSADPATPRAWARAVYSSFDIKQPGVADTQSEGHVSGLQVGTDVWVNGDWRAGVYVGHLEGEADIKGDARGINAGVGNNAVQSNYLGAYMTWMNADGFYVDTVLQGGDQRYTLRPDSNPNTSGKARSVTASIETGKPFPLGGRWSIEPQAQLIYQHTDVNDDPISGADVRIGADSGWIARLGVRIKGEMTTGVGTLLPYTRLNLYHATFGDDTTTFIGPAAATTISNPSGYSAAEAAAGTTWMLTPSTSLYGEIGHLWNMGGDATVSGPVQGSLGVRVRW